MRSMNPQSCKIRAGEINPRSDLAGHRGQIAFIPDGTHDAPAAQRQDAIAHRAARHLPGETLFLIEIHCRERCDALAG